MRNSAVGRVDQQALDRYLHDCEATGHAMCSDLGSSCNEDSPLCEQARQALWDSRRAEHDWSRFDVRQELVRLGSSSRTTDGQFLPCSDSFTIRSCRGRWCTTRGTPAPMGGQHADPAVLGGLQFCPEGGGSSCWAASLDSVTARKVFSSVVLVLSRPSGRSRWTQ